MKKLFLMIGIALFCLASIYAQKDEYIIQKTGNEIKLILKSDYVLTENIGNIKVEKDILEKYGKSRIICAWQEDTISVDADVSWRFSLWGLKGQRTTKEMFLVKKGNEVIEVASSPTKGEWRINWELIVLWILFFVAGVLSLVKSNGGLLSVIITVFVFLVCIVLLFFILICISHSLWPALIISIVCFVLGILCKYFYNKNKAGQKGCE